MPRLSARTVASLCRRVPAARALASRSQRSGADDVRGLERRELVGADADLGEDLDVVLAEQRRAPADPAGVLGEPERHAGEELAADDGMVDFLVEAAMLELRVAEREPGIAGRGRGHAVCEEQRRGFVGVARRRTTPEAVVEEVVLRAPTA